MMSKVLSPLYNTKVRTSFSVAPEIIPLQSLGVVDVGGNDIEENEVLAHVLANMTHNDQAEGWVIKRSSNFVNEYLHLTLEGKHCVGTPKNPNHLLRMFPTLFPYSEGSFEVNHPTAVSYHAHSHWAL